MKVGAAEFDRVNGDKEDVSKIKAAIQRHKELKSKKKPIGV